MSGILTSSADYNFGRWITNRKISPPAVPDAGCAGGLWPRHLDIF
jgi:hypothetical protein